ncbi:hypothetical protein BIW11_07631 [Tropilaelaps mercedesae]|uniref:Uncharacterized protein n=1 Tax=Tropilaelaps mercedesae TaxID=418985 RepID=A0A1V9XTD4_9ACAR|nr:hypothetical protein BIW11_07631 [Tropilaelaps mercedesae]
MIFYIQLKRIIPGPHIYRRPKNVTLNFVMRARLITLVKNDLRIILTFRQIDRIAFLNLNYLPGIRHIRVKTRNLKDLHAGLAARQRQYAEQFSWLYTAVAAPITPWTLFTMRNTGSVAEIAQDTNFSILKWYEFNHFLLFLLLRTISSTDIAVDIVHSNLFGNRGHTDKPKVVHCGTLRYEDELYSFYH